MAKQAHRMLRTRIDCFVFRYNSPGLKAVFVELKLLYPQGDDFHALLFHLIWERYVSKPLRLSCLGIVFAETVLTVAIAD